MKWVLCRVFPLHSPQWAAGIGGSASGSSLAAPRRRVAWTPAAPRWSSALRSLVYLAPDPCRIQLSRLLHSEQNNLSRREGEGGKSLRRSTPPGVAKQIPSHVGREEERGGGAPRPRAARLWVQVSSPTMYTGIKDVSLQLLQVNCCLRQFAACLFHVIYGLLTRQKNDRESEQICTRVTLSIWLLIFDHCMVFFTKRSLKFKIFKGKYNMN